MYRIGMFSKIGKTTVKTLRYYEKAGVLSPARVENESGYRYYTTEQLFKLHEIVALRQMNFSIEEIKNILAGKDVDYILQKRREITKKEVNIALDQLSRIDSYIEKTKENKFMNYQAVIKDIPEYKVYSKKTVLVNYEALFDIMPKLGAEITKLNPNLKFVEPAYCYNEYLAGEYQEENIEVDICEAVEEFGTAPKGVVFKKIKPITVATVLHKGAYEDLGAAYAFIFKWIEENGYKVVGNPRESYIDGIWNKNDKKEWLTELQVPIEN